MSSLQGKGLTALRMPAVSPALSDVEGDWCQNPHLRMEERTPLDARIAAERPALSSGLKKLREALGEATYTQYIDSVRNLTKSGRTLLLVADGFRHRSLLEREFIPAIKTAFDVSTVRVVANSYI